MTKRVFLILAFLFFIVFAAFSQTRVMPVPSYRYISFDTFKIHSPSLGFTLIQTDPEQSDKFFTSTISYTSHIATEIDNEYPDLYHSAIFSFRKIDGRHNISGNFNAFTDEPLYGGTRTFTSMFGYTTQIIKREHFSMGLGGSIMIMHMGPTVGDGVPWMVWPMPMFNFVWEYDWFTCTIIPGARITVGPKYPLTLVLRFHTILEYDGSLWYRIFKDGDYNSELAGFGAGFKRDLTRMMISDGGRYGIDHYAIYGSIRLFRLIELNGGWNFNGREKYNKLEIADMFRMFGYSANRGYKENVGNGYYVSLSVRRTR